MSKIRHYGLSEVDALTHEDPYVRCMARIASSDFAARMTDFINDELEREYQPHARRTREQMQREPAL